MKKFPSLLKLASQRKKVRLHKDCSELPVMVFFKIVETGDLSLLVINGKPTNRELTERWENILLEFERLTNSNDYRMQLRENSEDVRRVNRINALVSLYYINAFGGEDISEDLKYWKVPGNDYTAAKLEIMRERTRLDIDQIERSKEKPKQDFYDLWTAVENGLERNIDVEHCSVKKWVSLCKSLEQKANSYKKLQHGRQDKG